jgi:hypothetical protein
LKWGQQLIKRLLMLSSIESIKKLLQDMVSKKKGRAVNPAFSVRLSHFHGVARTFDVYRYVLAIHQNPHTTARGVPPNPKPPRKFPPIQPITTQNRNQRADINIAILLLPDNWLNFLRKFISSPLGFIFFSIWPDERSDGITNSGDETNFYA